MSGPTGELGAANWLSGAAAGEAALGVYWRADPEDMRILDGGDDRKREELIAERMRHLKSMKNV